jgi:hypothetical protein
MEFLKGNHRRLFLSALILLLGCALFGCDMKVNNYELDGYERACSTHGGIHSINNLATKATCNDGEWVYWNREK